MDPDQFASGQASTLRDDWQYSRIFSAPAARPGFIALLALRAELQQLQASTSEPGVAAVKFEWWRAEIERAFSGDAQHPVARALGKHLVAAGSAPEYCQELVDAAETEYGLETLSEQAFRLYLYRSGGVLAEQLLLLHGINERRALNAARRLGQLKRFIELISALHPMLRANRWLLPEQWQEPRQASHALMYADATQAQALVGTLFEHLDHDRVEVRTALEDVVLPPALALQWSLAQRDYKRLRALPALELLRMERTDAMLPRLWTAWRGARNAVRSQR